jgi:protocatechuate 3,4-dioxygenase, beta subunit
MNTQANRRQFLKIGTGTLGGLLLSSGITKAFAESCGITAAETSGPFYPGEAQFQQDNDLTALPGKSARALGQVIYIRGRILDQACKPVEGATIEIWQACATGRYNNPTDTNTAALDPGFKYWGETSTNKNGEYVFKSIIPGAYPADTNWMRPPHVHFKVSRLGYHELITQMYFEGQSLNDIDQILLATPASQRGALIVDFQPSSPELESGSLSGNFDITLRSVR